MYMYMCTIINNIICCLSSAAMTTPTHGQSLSSWIEEGSGSGVSLTGNITDNYPEYFGGVSHQPTVPLQLVHVY